MRCALRFCFVLSVELFLLLVFASIDGDALASIKINEVLPAPASDWNDDLAADSKQDEWVEISNDGATSVGLSGLFLLNGDSRAVVYGFSGVLAPGAHLVVHGDDASAWETSNGHSSIGLSLNNSGDVLRLGEVSGPDTTVIDSMAFLSSQVGYDVSIARLPDGSGAWTLFDHLAPMGGCGDDPTPGVSNSANVAPHIVAVTRTPIYPTQDDSVRIEVEAGDASVIATASVFYQISLENGEEMEMQQVSGAADFGVWAYTIPPCRADDTVRYWVAVHDAQLAATTGWMGYRVRGSGLAVKINEVLADPPNELAGDANRDGVRDSGDDEFVEIVNCGSTTMDLAGWKISDGTSVRHVFPDSGMTIEPGEFVTVFGGGSPTGFAGLVFTASTGGLSLTNTGDVVSLLDRSGGLVDIFSFGSEGGRDESLMRVPDCDGEWMLASDGGLTVAFTPNAPNGGGTSLVPATWGSIKGLFR
jgi:hypothetical protein